MFKIFSQKIPLTNRVIYTLFGVLSMALWIKLWGVFWKAWFLREDSWIFSTAPISFYKMLESVASPVRSFWYHRPARHWVYAFVYSFGGPNALFTHIIGT